MPDPIAHADEADPASAPLLEQWRADLAAWAIPDDIVAQAPESPWIHPVAMFTVADDEPDSPSHRRAREAVPPDGSVLDVGCGGGRAAMALTPPAGTVIGVDHQQEMLDAFVDAATARGVRSRTILGYWQAVCDEAPECDVVVCHHVAYNVPDIGPFLLELDRHARSRVVLELPEEHPLTSMNGLWQRFWDLERPAAPTADDLLAIARSLGLDAHLDRWTDEAWGQRTHLPERDRVRLTRIRLCLPEDRDAEVAAALAEQGPTRPRAVATLWWDPRRS